MDKALICEVAPRDGLQSAAKIFSVPQRVAFIKKLLHSGLPQIEVGSLVREDVVPSMAKSDQVFLQLCEEHPQEKPKFILLVPNERGLEKALRLGCQFVAFFTATSETFNQKNIRMGVAHSIQKIKQMIRILPSSVHSRLYISTVFHCPFEGVLPAQAILPFLELFYQVDEVSLGDTTGRGEPSQIITLHEIFLKEKWKAKIFWHFHDTYQKAVANIEKALSLGYRFFDSSAGGIGGCPFAPGAKGNIATELLLSVLEKHNIHHGIDQVQLQEAVKLLR